MPTHTIKGWHQGERAVHTKLGFADEVRMSYKATKTYMSEQHQVFHTSNVPFFPATILDEGGRPWGSVFAGKGGEIGFVKSPNETSLSMDLVTWEGDPLLRIIRGWGDDEILVSGIGVELSTRRRNKFAGQIESFSLDRCDEASVHLEMKVDSALGFVQITRVLFWLGIICYSIPETVRNTSTFGSSPPSRLRSLTSSVKTYN